MPNRRQEVWGDPIAHSKSPELHLAAYGVLGLDWDYRRNRVSDEQLADSFHTLPAEVGGLSLTMPLKEGILELVSDRRGPVNLLHAANTVVRGESGWWLDNTDWFGVDAVLNDWGGASDSVVWLLGAGATARSVIYALSQHTPQKLTLVVRDPGRARASVVLAETLGLSVEVCLFDQVRSRAHPDWVISTVPKGQVPNPEDFRPAASASRLMDAAYDPWPTPLATLWREQGHPAISGLAMLTYQALAQVRAFVGGDSTTALEREDDVVRAMRQAVGLDPHTGEQTNVGQ